MRGRKTGTTRGAAAIRSHHFSAADAPLFEVLPMIPQNPVRLHAHDFEELVIITGGQGTHFTSDKNYEVKAGDVSVIHPPLAHVTGLLSLMKTELEESRVGHGAMATAYFTQIVCFLSRCYAAMRGSAHAPLLRLGEVICHLEMNCDKSLCINELCKIADMSRSTLFRAFRKATGLAPIDHLVRLRVLRAAELLKSSNLAVKEVASRVGFADSNYFSRQYRRVMGESPRETRNQRRK